MQVLRLRCWTKLPGINPANAQDEDRCITIWIERHVDSFHSEKLLFFQNKQFWSLNSFYKTTRSNLLNIRVNKILHMCILHCGTTERIEKWFLYYNVWNKIPCNAEVSRLISCALYSQFENHYRCGENKTRIIAYPLIYTTPYVAFYKEYCRTKTLAWEFEYTIKFRKGLHRLLL